MSLGVYRVDLDGEFYLQLMLQCPGDDLLQDDV